MAMHILLPAEYRALSILARPSTRGKTDWSPPASCNPLDPLFEAAGLLNIDRWFSGPTGRGSLRRGLVHWHARQGLAALVEQHEVTPPNGRLCHRETVLKIER